jgi:xanthine dehydrogenase accessory factor
MHELTRILSELRARDSEPAALVTLLARDGSSYRKPGARMLVFNDATLGVVSGGCLESSLHVMAREVIASGQSRLVTIDTSNEDDLLWGYGLGCPGVLRFLIEPLSPQTLPDWLTVVRSALDERQRTILVTELTDLPRRFTLSGGQGQGELTLHPLAAGAEGTGQSHLASLDGAEFFVEVIDPPLSLLILGGGDDALPLTRFATELGWKTTVIDRRPAFARQERFPRSTVVCAHPNEMSPDLVASVDAAIITTHHYPTDRALLELLAPSAIRYIGVIGSPRRFRQLADELSLAAIGTRFFGPAGLDLGAEGSTEIALAIIAEIKAVMAGRNGTPLSNPAGGALLQNSNVAS